MPEDIDGPDSVGPNKNQTFCLHLSHAPIFAQKSIQWDFLLICSYKTVELISSHFIGTVKLLFILLLH